MPRERRTERYLRRSCRCSQTPLSEAMRKEGAERVKVGIQRCIELLQAQVASDGKPPPAPTPALPRPPMSDADKALAEQLFNGLPMMLRMSMHKIKTTPKGHVTQMKLAACSIADHHLPALIQLLHSSSVELHEIDLSFNEVRHHAAIANPTQPEP